MFGMKGSTAEGSKQQSYGYAADTCRIMCHVKAVIAIAKAACLPAHPGSSALTRLGESNAMALPGSEVSGHMKLHTGVVGDLLHLWSIVKNVLLGSEQ